jgi:3' terminal RNA ribose 2'-O-methyltransferase Hen1
MAGNCQDRPDLVSRVLDLECLAAAVPCEDPQLPKQLFEPLGYEVKAENTILDENFPEWGRSPLVDLTIRGPACVSAFLKHLYVLLPSMGGSKHYFIGRSEVDKLLNKGQGWLLEHPRKDFIINMYLGRRRNLTKEALDRLDRLDSGEGGIEEISFQSPRKPALFKLRLEAILDILKSSQVKSVLDYGCGEGRLLTRLLREGSFSKVAGLDVSLKALSKAETLVARTFKGIPPNFSLFHGSVTYSDARLDGFEAVVCQEVFEHLEPVRIPIFSKILFGRIKPKLAVITTPNIEYNINFPSLNSSSLRHPDHRFEMDRASFSLWASETAAAYGYTADISDAGESDPVSGSPTQIGIFRKC